MGGRTTVRLSAYFPPTMVRLNSARACDTPPRDEVVTQAVGMLDGDVAVTLPVDERVGVQTVIGDHRIAVRPAGE